MIYQFFDQMVRAAGAYYLSIGVTEEELRRALRVAIENMHEGAYEDGYCPACYAAFSKEFGEQSSRRGPHVVEWVVVGESTLSGFLSLVEKQLT